MDSVRLSQQLQNFLRKEVAELVVGFDSVARLLEVLGKFLYGLSMPSYWRLTEIERGEQGWHFRWRSQSDHAACPVCHTVSQHSAKLYTEHTVQDFPLAGKAVYHTVINTRYVCDQPDCVVYTFVEPMEGFARSGARLSNRLKTFLIRLALGSSINALPPSLGTIGIVVSRDTLLRLVKAQGATVIAQNLQRRDVKVLAVDDVNLRKGDASTACSVFIDGETHRFLLMVEGARQDTTEAVMAKFPTVEMVSRDRGSAYAAAAAAGGKLQVADGFHLIDNLHEAIKTALALTLGSDVFLPEGDGWIPPAGVEAPQPGHLPILTLSEADRERRIRIARLTARQARKYRTTLKLLELADSDLRTARQADRLGITRATLRRYRKEAPDTIAQVESKLDAWTEARGTPAAPRPLKTLAPGARPASESIVAPYRETVLRLAAQGEGHQKIHAAIIKEGFAGSANAVYQYLLKVRQEDALAAGVPSDDRPADDVEARPLRIGLTRIARGSIYRRLLKEVAQERATVLQARTGLASAESTVVSAPATASVPAPWINTTAYDDATAAIIFDTRSKESKPSKALSPETYAHLEAMLPSVARFRACLSTFTTILDTGDEAGLDQFIQTYQDDASEPIAVFASGLQQDLEAVNNCLRYPAISNGPMVGTNNKIKMVRRRGYGRAGLELLNALFALPWYYYDLDPTQAPHPEAA